MGYVFSLEGLPWYLNDCPTVPKELTSRILANIFWSFATLLWSSNPQLYPVALRLKEMQPQEGKLANLRAGFGW